MTAPSSVPPFCFSRAPVRLLPLLITSPVRSSGGHYPRHSATVHVPRADSARGAAKICAEGPTTTTTNNTAASAPIGDGVPLMHHRPRGEGRSIGCYRLLKLFDCASLRAQLALPRLANRLLTQGERPQSPRPSPQEAASAVPAPMHSRLAGLMVPLRGPPHGPQPAGSSRRPSARRLCHQWRCAPPTRSQSAGGCRRPPDRRWC